MKLWTETSKLQAETSKKFPNLPCDLHFRTWFIFQIWFYYLVYKANRKVSFQGRSEKFYEVSILSFILNLKVSDQSFEIRGTLEPFWLYTDKDSLNRQLR